jgi:glutamyl-tRNA reductase
VDIVISSTGSPDLIIRKEQVKKIMKPRRHRLLFLIDIAVPRNIDPGANDVENVYLYDIDDLKGVVEANIEERKKEAVKAERIIEEEVIKLSRWLEGLNIVPVIKGLQKKAEEIRLKELERSSSVLSNLTDEQRKAIDLLTQSIARKIIHDPIICLKKESRGEHSDSTLDTALRLFSLNGTQKNNH